MSDRDDKDNVVDINSKRNKEEEKEKEARLGNILRAMEDVANLRPDCVIIAYISDTEEESGIKIVNASLDAASFMSDMVKARVLQNILASDSIKD